MQVVGEGRVRPDKDIILDPQPIPKINAVFQRYPVTDDNIIFDEALRADIAVAANPGTGQDDGELPDARAVADPVGLDIGERVDGRTRLGHDGAFIPFFRLQRQNNLFPIPASTG